jgi:MoaA/NifB/PqqE/SkfB family radical SAM enzyme
MKYDIEVDWRLFDTCNYRCAYCGIPPEKLGAKVHAFATPQGWRAAFDATGSVWLVHITGGEPCIYPGFVDLCEGLTARHYISVNSNLTHPSLLRFAERIDPSRVSFINASLHLEERERRSGNGAFLRHAQRLRAAGFRVMVSLVASRQALARFEEAVELLAPLRLFPIPKLMRGVINGVSYPGAYTALDKERFRRCSHRARAFHRALPSKIAEPPSLDMLNDDFYVDGLPDFTGALCEAGHRFVDMHANGDIFRCGSKTPLGNLLDGSFARRMKPAPCDSRHCYYFCNKHVVRRPGEPTLRLPQRKTVPATVRVRRAIARGAIRGLLAVWPFSV